MTNENIHLIIDSWSLFKEYVDKKHINVVAEKYVDILVDYGIDEKDLKDILSEHSDKNLDSAILYYLTNYDIDEDY